VHAMEGNENRGYKGDQEIVYTLQKNYKKYCSRKSILGMTMCKSDT
jgi:hypothetical protein